MNYPRLWVTTVLVVFLTACGSTVRQGSPAPVVSGNAPGGDRTPVVKGDEPVVRAYQPPQQVAIARPQPARAVQVLIRRADDQKRQGDLPGAVTSLERALRIEPRNATLWNRLAHVRSVQGLHGKVEQFAAKSNALAGSDDVLRADNWSLIAGARSARGDERGASRAREQARVLQ